MTVAELIEQLKRLDPESEIVVAHPEHDICQTETAGVSAVCEHEILRFAPTGLQSHPGCWVVVDERDKLEDSDVTKEVVVIR